jgi:hypothetical protein
VVGAMLILLGIICAQLVFTDLGPGGELVGDPFFLFHRNFWVDELHTYAIVSDPDFLHSMEALANCVDGSPPTFHVLLRLFTTLTGGAGEGSHRAFAFVCVLLALAGIYTALRQVFARWVSFTAVLAVWNHPLVLVHAFEGRYYGPWLAATVWFAYFFARTRVSPRPLNQFFLALTAVLVCTIHYFGIFTLGLVTCFELLLHRPSRTSRWTGLAAAGLGAIALLACTPFYLRQRAGLSVPTWIEVKDLKGTIKFVKAALEPGYLWVVLLGGWLALLTGPGRGDRGRPAGPDAAGAWPRPDGGPAFRAAPLGPNVLAGLSGVVLLPLVIIVFSLVVQPSLEDRYAMPAAAALAPAVAFVLARAPRVWLAGFCALFIVVGTVRLRENCQGYREADESTEYLIEVIRRQTGDAPVVFESIHQLYVVGRYAPDLAGRCYKLDFENDEIGSEPARLIDRDLARRFAESYGKPGLMKWADVCRLRKKFIVPDDDVAEINVSEVEDLYPGFKLAVVEGGLALLVPQEED